MAAVLGLAAAPATAMPRARPSTPGHPHKGPTGTHGPSGAGSPSTVTGRPAGARAYGVSCRDQSKKHVAGQPGTPFSRCVAAMAKLASGKTASPQAACASLSRRHAPGERGTPFSRCVAAGAKLLRDRGR